MTPKDKAQGLMESFYGIMLPEENPNIRMDRAKQCALLCVDEILSMCEWYERRYKTKTVPEYWQEVKQEIEKL